MNMTISLAGSEVKAEFSGVNAWLRNDGADVIYAAAKPGITAGADGVVAIPAGQSAPIYGANGTVWLLGTGSVQLIGSDYSTNPFKTSAQAGGSGADDVARAAISAHSGNADIHVTATEKAAWDGKADKTYVDEALKGKSDTGHTHDNRYYTESETDTLLNGKAATNHAHSNVTTSAAGFMSSSDKSKLDGISESADSVSVSPSLTSGTKVGTITINGTAYDLYCQTNTDTKYSAGTGISISGTTIINSGVRSIASGGSNGTISVNTNGSAANVAVKGLASAAYQAVQTAAGTVGLHRISSGTADATTTNCPAGCWYGRHS